MAARAWVRNELFEPAGVAGPTDDAVADARRFGFDEDCVASISSADKRYAHLDGFDGVWPENVPAVKAFLFAASQWRTAGTAHRVLFIGIDYAAAAIAWSANGIEMTADLFARFAALESAACAVLNEASP